MSELKPILLVEDNERLAEHIAGCLTREGMAVDRFGEAADGAAALETIRYDAAVLDLGLPDGDGLDVLREARELARGYRQTDLSRELEGARSLLESAGITVELDVEGLPPERHEAAAWVVREGVTNVLRHSTAGSVAIRARADHLEVVNDGARETADAGGSGLLGLRERLAPRGAVLAGGRDGTTYRLTVRWDAG
mgnify:CR=1 FL=1